MGYMNAQFCLGIFMKCIVNIQKVKNSFYWYLKASHQGDGQSTLAVAYYYGQGIGTVKDEKKSFEAYQKQPILEKEKRFII